MEAMKGCNAIVIYKEILDVFIYDAAAKVRKAAHDTVYSYGSGESMAEYIRCIDILTSVAGVNIKESRRKIAGKLISDNLYKY